MSEVYRYYLNSLFDLELGGYPTDAVKRSAAEMSVLFLPLMRSCDRIVLDVGLPEGYLDYLEKNGCSACVKPDDPFTGVASAEDIVWGWNRAAADRLASKKNRLEQQISATAEINNRRFCHHCAAEYGAGVPGSQYCASADETYAVAVRLAHAFPLVVKPAFGGSGFGFHIVDNMAALTAQRSSIAYYCNHGGCTIEPWCSRVADISSCTIIDSAAGNSSFLMHRQGVNRFGAFYGIYIDDNDQLVDRWRNDIERISTLYVRDIIATGYEGPLGFDSFVYRDSGGCERCAAGIEINGRYTMGFLAHKLRRTIAPQKNILLRVISAKKCRLPDTYDKLKALFGENSFDHDTRKGIILLTPLTAYYQGRWEQPQRSVFFIAGDSLEQIEKLDMELRSAVAKRGRHEPLLPV